MVGDGPGQPQAAPVLRGRSAVITGGTRGLGLEIARSYLKLGARGVCICGRDEAPLRLAEAELQALAGAEQKVLALRVDVASETDVEQLMQRAVECFGDLSILVSNAGVYGPKEPLASADWQEWTRAIEINLFGSALSIRAALEHLVASGQGKVIQIAGGGDGALHGRSAYAASKAAVIRVVETLAAELRERGDAVDVNAIAPGALNTRLLDEVLQAGPERVGHDGYRRALEQQRSGGVSLQCAAELAIFLGSAASDGITGKLLSAVWDPWMELPARRSELESDIYTLRRIVPRDRGLGWGDGEAWQPGRLLIEEAIR
jgi:NAD(P)-dependent dehydrogenase (short-subunit alcohol dehydrogenase family)